MGRGEKGAGMELIYRYGLSIRDDGKLLEIDGRNGCTTL